MNESADIESGESVSQPVGLADLAFLLENLPALGAFIGPDQTYRYVNRAYEKFCGRSRKEILGKTIRDIAGPEHQAIAAPHIVRVLKGEPQTFLSSIRHNDGILRDVEVSYTPQRNESGDVIGFISLIQDWGSHQEISEGRSRLAAIVDSSEDVILSTTFEGIVTSWNRAAEKIFGYADWEVIGKHFELIIPSEKRAEAECVLARLRKGEKIDHFETERRTKDGRIVFVSVSVSPIRNAYGEMIGASMVIRDMTSSKQAELRDAFLVRLDDATRSLSDPREITAVASKLLCDHLNADRCSYAEIDVAGGQIDIVGNYSSTLPSILGRYVLSSFGPAFLSAMSAGRPYIFRDAARELPEDAFAAYQAIGISAVMAIPLVKEKLLVAGMGVHQSTPRDWAADEIELVRIVANRCWESIERARAQRELLASEELFRSIVQAAAEGIWIIDTEGRTTFVNPRMSELLGYQASEMLGRPCFDFIHPEDKERGQQGFSKRKDGNDPEPREYRFIRHDGAIRWLSFVGSAMYDVTGRITGVLAMCTDTTERRLADERIRHLNSEVLARLSEVEALLSVVPIGIAFSYDPECLVLKFNPEAHRIFGTKEVSKPASSSWDEMPYRILQNGVDVPRRQLPLQIAASAGVNTRDAEFEVVRQDGQVVQILCSASPLFDADGAPRGSVAAIVDITNRKSTENSLRRANSALEQFAYAAAHDLQEPARNVAIFAQLLARECKGSLNSAANEYLKVTVEGAQRLQNLIRDLLSYTRAASDDEELPQSESDGNSVFEEVIQNLRSAIEMAGAEVTTDDLPQVAVPHGHFVQLLQNVVSNSLKYRSAEPPRIRISAARQGKEWVFKVKDNGLGISPEFHHRIFGVFKRLHGKEISGTGIGLAICERIVSCYGGTIRVESELGQGATFCFTLPPSERPV